MKRYICMLMILLVSLLLSCSVGESDNKVKATGDAKPKVGINKSAKKSNVSKSQIVCDKFKLIATLKDSSLSFYLDTDLPDNTVVMVSVSRTYFKVGDSETYSSDYFSEKSNIGEWKLLHIISLDSEAWKASLKEHQKMMSSFGENFDVVSISDNIEVRMVVPINQPDPKFGKGNKNLTGKMVSTGLFRVVRDEVEINYPLN